MRVYLRQFRPRSPRRGITLVEMLVSVALLVLMMTVIVQVFAAATGAVSASRTYQELTSNLSQLDATIRQDLMGVTARFTPPLNPKDNLGYFEYGENTWPDNQGEDCDDYIRFTARAPEGQYFTGRFWPKPNVPLSSLSAAQYQEYVRTNPITIQSRTAEIIYFLRNGNLYRRVLLVAPELESSMSTSQFNTIPSAFGGESLNTSNMALGILSWQGMNDLSARPNVNGYGTLRLNTLGDLTNRENRFASPRFINNFVEYDSATNTVNTTKDLILDDVNEDTVPDFYPSLYFGALSPDRSALPAGLRTPLVNEVPPARVGTVPPPSRLMGGFFDTMPFPYVFPGAYSKPVVAQASGGLGWIHGPDPTNAQNSLFQLNQINHNPLDIGDNLPGPTPVSAGAPAGQTWWGFPTWRETLAGAWTDPTNLIINGGQLSTGQANGLHPRDASVTTPTSAIVTNVPFLPPMTTDVIPGTTTPYRTSNLTNTDSLGTPRFAATTAAIFPADYFWRQSWEDDLIMTGVRSFDVKAYDDSFGGYVDLGWGNDLRLYTNYIQSSVLAAATPSYLGVDHLVTVNGVNVVSPILFWPPSNAAAWPPRSGPTYDLINQSFAHEGRIPPRVVDNRADFQFPSWSPNLGDDNASVVRLRRVWDTWSTDYSYAPANSVFTNKGDPTDPLNGQRLGPPNSLPIYPSYPPPYPMALRGLQIQIRVVDPRNERIKTLTIRQDFSNRL